VGLSALHALQDLTQLESKLSTQNILTHAASMGNPSTLTLSSTSLNYTLSTPTASEFTELRTHEGFFCEL